MSNTANLIPAAAGGAPVRETLLSYGKQIINEEDIKAVVDTLRSDFLTQGPRIKQFEDEVARYAGARFAVAFSNGTAALHAACYAAGIGPGDEAITSPITFAASANCVRYCGGTVVFADIEPDTYNINPELVRKSITAKTKAIIPVDFTGQPVDLEEIMAIAAEHRLIVIEDAAHALGALYKGRRVGSIADMTMFSFHPVKHITTGEGGMIVTNRQDLYEKLLQFRTHGITRDAHKLEGISDGPWYYEMQELGFNYRMTDIQAALGCSQLAKLDAFIARRKEIVQQYNERFRGLDTLVLPFQKEDRVSSWHLYVIQLRLERLKVGRREIFEGLRAENIGVNVHYIPVHLQPYYQRLGYKKGLAPIAEEAYERFITLPLFPAMTEQDVQDVGDAVEKVLSYYKS